MKNHRATDKTEEVREHLIGGVQVFLAATAHVAQEKVVEGRQWLTAAIERGKETWNTVLENMIAGAKATDQVIRNNLNQAYHAGLGVGALIGDLTEGNV
jgi:ElaB/YqjD/DUF883 family membrane-anchored ribosome-binding protein